MKDLYRVLEVDNVEVLRSFSLDESEIPDNALWGVSPREPGVQVDGPILIPIEGSGYLADAWIEFRRLEKSGVVQPAIEQGMRVKALLDALAGWPEDDEDEDDDGQS
ncbi:hypothetical protein LCGC14_2399670 [marine sediment metagenome]|uniref:Uncharacterized protein n=1 Tax=marine sediment metagenome TaxID=412755 RepID=A0A0F9EQ49_9ZZZZ